MECAESILGGNLSTETKKGSFAAAKVQALVRQDLLEFDATVEADIANTQILPQIAEVNFNDPSLAPVLEIIAEPATDVFLRAKALADLARFLVVAPKNVDTDALMVEYGVKLLPQAEDQPVRDRTPRLRLANAGPDDNED